VKERTSQDSTVGRSGGGGPEVSCESFFKLVEIRVSISTIKTFIRRSSSLRSSKLWETCRLSTSASNSCVSHSNRSEELGMGAEIIKMWAGNENTAFAVGTRYD
jgi:hypothetical protein